MQMEQKETCDSNTHVDKIDFKTKSIKKGKEW